jgi:ABC-type dipeptide/oligopeptide/nickel transport system permease subunit
MKPNSRWKWVLERHKLWGNLGLILSLSLIAIFATQLAPHDPLRMNIGQGNLPPSWVQNSAKPGKPEFPLGTDLFGRDLLSRLIYGTRAAVFLILTAVPCAALIGTLLGMLAGYAGGWIEAVIMRFTDILNSLPNLMFAVMMVLILRRQLPPTPLSGMLILALSFAAIGWVSLARLVRGAVLQIKGQLFMEASRSLGASSWHLITRHLLPNVMHIVLVWVINTIPTIILLEAILGYLGIQVTSATPGNGNEFSVTSWGGLFRDGRAALSRNPFMLFVPALCVLLISMSFTLLGDFLSEITRQRQEEF